MTPGLGAGEQVCQVADSSRGAARPWQPSARADRNVLNEQLIAVVRGNATGISGSAIIAA